MKAGWQAKTLGETCQIARGGSPRPIQEFITDDPNGVNWVKISDATASGKFIYETKEKIKPSGVSRSRLVKPGDFLLSNSMSFGRPYIMQTTGCIHDGWLVLSGYEQCFDQSFLYHLLGSPVVFEQFDRLAAGSTVRNLNIDLASRVSLPVPPLSEQHRIVAILDEAFDGIATAKANAEKNLKNARALFESHLQKVFTQRGEEWIEKRLGDVFTTATGTTPPKSNADFYGDFIPLVKPPELCNELIDSASDGLSEDGAAVARLLPQKSILVSCIGNLGKVGLNTVPVAFNQQINAILPDESHAIPEFMFFQTLAPVFKEQLESLASGTTVPIVNKSKFNSVGVVLPPLPIQRSVAAQFSLLREETQRLESLYQRKLAALDALKQSLLHQAFSGAL